MSDNWIRKTLVFVVIVLFIGVAVMPGINGYFEEIEFQSTVEGIISKNYDFSIQNIEVSNSQIGDTDVLFEENEIVENSKIYNDSNPKISNVYNGYIIITIPPLVDALEDFRLYKESLGYSVRVIDIDWISSNVVGGDIQEKIRVLLSYKYTMWEIKYVLIVGSHNTIPMRYCYPGTKDESGTELIVPTDYYYADLTGDWDSDHDQHYGEPSDDDIDFIPEVYVGRIPFDDYERVVSICNKIKNFESDKNEWKKNALLLGAILGHKDQFWSGVPRTDGADLMEELWDGVFKNNGYSRTSMYEKGGIKPSIYPCDYPLNHENVLTHWPNGYSVVVISSHGSPTGAWRMIWTQDINDDNIPQTNEITWQSFIESLDKELLNDEKPSIVVTDGCRNSNPWEENNLGTALLENGAVAFIGGTSFNYFYDGWENKDDGGSDSHHYYFFHYLINMGESLGEALFDSKIYYFDNLMDKPPLEWRNWNYHNLYSFCLYGDPSMQLEEQVGEPPEVPEILDAPTTLAYGETYEFTAVSTDPDDDDVRYEFTWDYEGDWTFIETDFMESGEPCTVKQSFESPGHTMHMTMDIQAMDTNGLVSGWCEPIGMMISDPPTEVYITGPTSGTAGEEYVYYIRGYDPNSNDLIDFNIDWDDGDDMFISDIPIMSEVNVSHIWSRKGDYQISVTVYDFNGLQGPTETLSVSMPKNKFINTPFLQFLENHPNLFPLLRQLLGGK